jgi:hypothetical protein
MSAARGEILLLSVLPEAHREMVHAMRSNGITVRAPHQRASRRAFGGRPDLILVDLVHGTGLTREMVAALNRRSGRAMVVALHEGMLGSQRDEASELVVEGYCRCTDWRPLLRALVGREGTGASRPH